MSIIQKLVNMNETRYSGVFECFAGLRISSSELEIPNGGPNIAEQNAEVSNCLHVVSGIKLDKASVFVENRKSTLIRRHMVYKYQRVDRREKCFVV